ncbi:MAG: hypothetical protein Udaeo_02630 [Candidatus Udaeobacter sp.]|nr:MAG: hypothetical protein Udaeo_02630 [Candidatus Udaeobacter sp.]
MSTGMILLPVVAGRPMPLKVIGPARSKVPAPILLRPTELLIGVLMGMSKPAFTLIMPVPGVLVPSTNVSGPVPLKL